MPQHVIRHCRESNLPCSVTTKRLIGANQLWSVVGPRSDGVSVLHKLREPRSLIEAWLLSRQRMDCSIEYRLDFGLGIGTRVYGNYSGLPKGRCSH